MPSHADDGTIPESFIEQVKEVLENLYDLPYLQKHPLSTELFGGPLTGSDTPAQSLRREVMASIELLNPGPGVSFRAPNARLYMLLNLRYIEGLNVSETANELNISRRQAYRDLRRGEESIAATVWAQHYSGQNINHRQPPSTESEINQLEFQPRLVDLRDLLNGIKRTVGPLGVQRQVTLEIDILEDSPSVYADAAVAQQVLTSIISRAIQHANAGSLYIELEEENPNLVITMVYAPAVDAKEKSVTQATPTELLDRLGWRISQEDEEPNRRVVTIEMSKDGPIVLVIDDNEGLIDLVGTYLAGNQYRVVGATSADEGLELAREVDPAVIILDVMMPGKDGWEVLQTLKSFRETADTPVIVCTVFNDPELAYSLGASLFLPKPIEQDRVLNALLEVGIGQ